jgi:hypothetical protein
MAFNVDQFRANLTGDGARPNLFQVSLILPGYVGNAGAAGQKLTFMCNAAQLPESTIGMTPAYYFGREVKLAGNRTYGDWTIQIINDEDFLIRNAMEEWHSNINGPVGNKRATTAETVDDGYGVNATVIQYAKDSTAIKQYQFVGMWPTSISNIDLNWQSNDQLEEFSVTFAYQYYLPSGIPTL